MTEEPLLSASETDENNKRRQKLMLLISSGEAILMAGAGCSGAIYPPWPEFVNLLNEQVKKFQPDFDENPEDFLTFADKAKEAMGEDPYYHFMYQQFCPKQDKLTTDLHTALCRLPFKAFTTTNYDLLLDTALRAETGFPDTSVCFDGENKVKIYEFLSSINPNSGAPKRVIHLHGKYDINNSIILGGKEYASKYGFTIREPAVSLFDQIQAGDITRERFQELLVSHGYEWPIRRKILWTLLAARRIVFMGFSMNDPYFLKMLDFVKVDLSTYEAETHYLVLRITSENKKYALETATRLKREYGIECVFFPDDESFNGLTRFTEGLVNEIVPPVRTKRRPVAEVAEVSMESNDGDEALTEELFALTKKQD